MSEQLSDDILMAYADGELEASARRQVTEALARDTALRKRLRIFERTGTVLGQAFDAALSAERLPAELSVRRPTPAVRWTIKFRRLLAPAYGYGLAVAATVLLIAGSAMLLRPFPFASQEPLVIASPDGRLLAGGSLRIALETQQSKGFGAAPADAPAITQTFRDQEGRFCREYIAMPGSSQGIACRGAGGSWLIALHASGLTTHDSSTSAPAGSGPDQLIDSYVHQTMAGNPLAEDAELAAIAGRWPSE